MYRRSSRRTWWKVSPGISSEISRTGRRPRYHQPHERPSQGNSLTLAQYFATYAVTHSQDCAGPHTFGCTCTRIALSQAAAGQPMIRSQVSANHARSARVGST